MEKFDVLFIVTSVHGQAGLIKPEGWMSLQSRTRSTPTFFNV